MSNAAELLFDGGVRDQRNILIEGDKARREKDDDGGGDDDLDSKNSNSYSSIGNNSDDEDEQANRNEEEEEVESSSCNSNNNNNDAAAAAAAAAGPFDAAIQALEDALPLSRRGMSRFYDGKSKSFTSLTDAADSSSSSSSMKDIAKPENPYTKRRRNLLAHNLAYGDDNKNNNKIYSSFQLQLGHNRGRGDGTGRISKRPTNSSCRTALALAVAMSTTDSNFNNNSTFSPCSSPRQTTCHGNGDGGPLSLSSSLLSPHAHRNLSALRSFSFADLQHCTSLTARPFGDIR